MWRGRGDHVNFNQQLSTENATAIMMIPADDFTAYRSLRVTRDDQGILVLEFHSDGGPLIFTARDHTDFVDAFYRIAQG